MELIPSPFSKEMESELHSSSFKEEKYKRPFPVQLNGWVHRIRTHGGGVYFIDLRDGYGMVQIVVDKTSPPRVRDLVKHIRPEYCLFVKGVSRPRLKGTENNNMEDTGRIEIHPENIILLSKSAELPFSIEKRSTKAREDLRMQYRYLDLRSGDMKDALVFRHKAAQAVRQYLNEKKFLEIETPTLIRSTPEGARDFLVPSRIMPGSFYALAQSPQLYKQMLMVGGIDCYYQFAHCYRDEDARGDRQPEHTQIDIEMSFKTAKSVQDTVSGLLRTVFPEQLEREEIECISYDDAMCKYGTDKPDLRYKDVRIYEVTNIVKGCGFTPFEEAAETPGSGVVMMLRVPEKYLEHISSRHIDELEALAVQHGAKGLAHMYCEFPAQSVVGPLLTKHAGKLIEITGRPEISTEQAFKTPPFSAGIARFFNDVTKTPHARRLQETGTLEDDDLIFFVAVKDANNNRSPARIAQTILGAVRREIIRLFQKALPEQEKKYKFVWVTDFPLFERDEETGAWTPTHHMFTMPQPAYIDTLESDPAAVKGELYDLVCNGIEIASGSIRIHNAALQQRIFRIIGMSDEQAVSRFGFLLEALKYGAPPHGGIAIGFDRLIMLMLGKSTIRDCIAFPKNTNGASPMDGCPNTADKSQLEELHLSITKSAEKFN